MWATGLEEVRAAVPPVETERAPVRRCALDDAAGAVRGGLLAPCGLRDEGEPGQEQQGEVVDAADGFAPDGRFHAREGRPGRKGRMWVPAEQSMGGRRRVCRETDALEGFGLCTTVARLGVTPVQVEGVLYGHDHLGLALGEQP